MFLSILIVLLVCSIVFGGWSHESFGYVGWSPLGIVLAIIVVLALTGQLRFR